MFNLEMRNLDHPDDLPSVLGYKDELPAKVTEGTEDAALGKAISCNHVALLEHGDMGMDEYYSFTIARYT